MTETTMRKLRITGRLMMGAGFLAIGGILITWIVDFALVVSHRSPDGALMAMAALMVVAAVTYFPGLLLLVISDGCLPAIFR